MTTAHRTTQPLVALGLATCILPLVVAAALGWWSPWAGVGVGAAVAILFGALWFRLARQPRFLVGILCGVFFAAAGATLFVPSLRAVTGTATTFQIGDPPPPSTELRTLKGIAPRTDLLHVGPVFEYHSSNAGTNYKYSIVAPLVPGNWTPDAEVVAWVICEEDDGSASKTAWALKRCGERLAGDALVVEHEDFDADLPNAPMIAEAMAAHSLRQSDGAPIFVLRGNDEAWAGVIVPLILALLAIGFVTGAVKRHRREADAAAAAAASE